MFTTTVADFQKNLKKYIKSITENFETLVINLGKEKGVVVMSIDEYNSLAATRHELSLKINEKRLDAAIEKIDKGDFLKKSYLIRKVFICR